MGSWFCRSLGKDEPPLVILWAHFWLVFERGSSGGDNFTCCIAWEISWIFLPEGRFQKAFFFLNHLDHTFSARSLSYNFFLRLEALTKKGDFWWSCEEVLILFSYITQHALRSISCSEVCVVETHSSDFIGTSAIITPFTKSTAEEDKESKVHVMCVPPDILSFVKMKPRWLRQTIGSV